MFLFQSNLIPFESMGRGNDSLMKNRLYNLALKVEQLDNTRFILRAFYDVSVVCIIIYKYTYHTQYICVYYRACIQKYWETALTG